MGIEIYKNPSRISAASRTQCIILATVSVLLFVLAILFPFLAVPAVIGISVSVWKLSPLGSIAAGLFWAFSAYFPIWHSRRRSWLLPFIVGIAVDVMDVLVFFYVSYLVSRGHLFIVIPLWVTAIAGTLVLSESLVLRKAINSSSHNL